MVDAQGFAQENDRWSPRLDPLHQVVRTRSRSRSVDSFAYRSPPRRGRHSRRYSDAGRDHEQVEPAIELADELLVYCTPMVRGFILANKQWGESPCSFAMDSANRYSRSLHRCHIRDPVERARFPEAAHSSTIQEHDPCIREEPSRIARSVRRCDTRQR